jgi:hypothetical protein
MIAVEYTNSPSSEISQLKNYYLLTIIYCLSFVSFGKSFSAAKVKENLQLNINLL